MYGRKESITKDAFTCYDDWSFLSKIDMLDPATISPGMWNKLYALLAIKRKAIGNNICIYSGTQYEYDVTNRTYWARITEEEIAKLKQAL